MATANTNIFLTFFVLVISPKFAQYHFYRKGLQGAAFLVYNLEDFTSNSIHMTKEDCSLLSLSVESVLSELRRVSGIWLVYYTHFKFPQPM